MQEPLRPDSYVSPALFDASELLQPTSIPEPEHKGIVDEGLPEGWPDDAQSTTGPIPPPSIGTGKTFASVDVGNILSAPAYLWYRGCGPTASGMVIGYWDGHGFDDLVVGSAATQTSAVEAMISSTGNWDDYCLPLDYAPDPIQPDKSEPPVGDEHPDDSVADFMMTSQSSHSNYYGWSWFSDIDDAMEGYVNLVAPHYYANARNVTWGTFTWDTFKAEIDAGRPVSLLVDTNADGGTDHFITAVGYSAEGSPQQYAALNTWDRNVHWYDFARMNSGQWWGIYGATYFKISTSPLVANDDFDDAINISSLPFADGRDILDATTAADDPDLPCGNGGTIKGAYSVWYRYTPSTNVIVNIDTFGSDYDTVLNVWMGTRGNLTNVACNDDSGVLQSSLQVGMLAGTTSYIEVTAYGDWTYGTLTLNVSEEPFTCNSVSEIPTLECEALVAFYNSTNGDEWGNWKTTFTPCTDWTGVVCGGGHVTQLALAQKGIEGMFHAKIYQLDHLISLDLADNNLSGSLPDVTMNWPVLETFHIPGNQFDGNLPPTLGSLSSLKLLYVNSNQFGGPIPPEIGDLSNLEVFYASKNRLYGEIPPELGNLASITNLSLDGNLIFGEIPAEIGNLTGLNYLRLHNNALEGDVPATFTNLTNLSTSGLNLGYNMLTATDSTLVNFLNAADPDWAGTQTIPPSDLYVQLLDPETVDLQWTPITYTGHGGYYQIRYATESGGPYTWITNTLSKTNPQIIFGRGSMPAGPIYLVIRTYTPAHGDQQNDLLSEYSSEVVVPPINDDFNDAIFIGSIDFEDVQDTTNATTAPDDPNFSCPVFFNGTGAHSVWYSYTPNGDEFLSVDTIGSEYDTVLAVWTGTRGNLDLVTCNDDALDVQSQGNFFADGGETYFIEVIGYGASASGIMSLHVNETGFTCDAVTEIPKSECEALEALFTSTDGENWTNNDSWLKDGAPCAWYGIGCNSGHVVDLDMYDNNLNGPLSSEIGNLVELTHLTLLYNQLGGPLPSSIGNLTQLKRFRAGDSQLTGELPVEIGNLQSLEDLNLMNNQLTGNIPDELGSIPTLRFLDLSENDLSGPIPPELGNIEPLEWLILRFNNLTGEIPVEIASLSQLQILWLSYNHLEGTIPLELGDLSLLERLTLDGNQLTGIIPASLGNLSQLTHLNLSENHLDGSIPLELGELSLTSLYLYDNQLEGSIPSGLVDSGTLRNIMLNSNALEGEIPSSITSNTDLGNFVDFGYNMLYSTNTAVIGFLAEKDPDWYQSQTIPPVDFEASIDTSERIVLTWTPIPYTSQSGYYEIGYSTTQGGPYSIHGHTFDKTISTYTIDDLDPGSVYYFVVRTFTPVHGWNQSNLVSTFGEEVEILLPGAELSMPEGIPGLLNVNVSLPVTFTNHGREIASTIFSLDFDETCLSFDPTDGDLDGVPDAINFNLPVGFTGLVTVGLTDTDGELDFLVADTVPPMSGLSDGTIANVTFTVTCQPGEESYFATVGFSDSPGATFGSVEAESVMGITSDGSVEIQPGTIWKCYIPLVIK
jgi:Leucine-rich repeat (LRR) protein